jgi:S1-C subfamily serine protease
MGHTFRRSTLYASLSISLFLIVLLGACVRQGTDAPATDANVAAERQSPPADANVTAEGLSPLAPLPVIGIVIDDTMTVLYVEPGSGAQAAGILAGDVIRDINGLELAQNIQAAKNAIGSAQPGQKIEVRGESAGQPFAVEVEPRAPQLAAPLSQENPPPTGTPVIAPDDYL